jgi:hypothetical protein
MTVVTMEDLLAEIRGVKRDVGDISTRLTAVEARPSSSPSFRGSSQCSDISSSPAASLSSLSRAPSLTSESSSVQTGHANFLHHRAITPHPEIKELKPGRNKESCEYQRVLRNVKSQNNILRGVLMNDQTMEAKEGVLRSMCVAYPMMERSSHSTKLSLSCMVRARKRLGKEERTDAAKSKNDLHQAIMGQFETLENDETPEGGYKVISLFWNHSYFCCSTLPFLQRPKKMKTATVAEFKAGLHISIHNLGAAWYVGVLFAIY